MALTTTQALAAQSVQLRGQVEMQKDDGTWLDLSDRVNQDRLVTWAGLRAAQEEGLGVQIVQAGSVTVDNADGYFSGAPPTGIASWDRQPVRLSLRTAAGTQSLGIFLLDDIEAASDSPDAVLHVVEKSVRLTDKPADRVRQGQGWHVNKPLSYLVREILKQEFTDAEVTAFQAAGGILGRYQIPLATTTLSADATNRAISHLGRPPEWDGTVWREDALDVYGNPLLFVTDPLAGAMTNTLVAGLGNELWYWRPTDDTWVKIGTLAGAGLSSEFRIMHLAWSTHAGVRAVVGVAWKPDVPGSTTAAPRDRSGAKNSDVRFFSATAATGISLYGAFVPPSAYAIYTGHFAVRAGGWSTQRNGVGATPRALVENTESFGINCPRPFGTWTQVELAQEDTAVNHWTGYNRNLNEETPSQQYAGGQATKHATVRDGHVSWTIEPITADLRPMDFSWNCGQHQGAFALQHAGKYLVFFTINWNAGAATYEYRLWRMDCSVAGGDYRYFDTVTNTWVTSGGTPYRLRPTASVGGIADSQPYAIDWRPDDKGFGVCSAIWKEGAWSANDPPADSLIGIVTEHTWAASDMVGAQTVSLLFDASGTANPNNWTGHVLARGLPLSIRYGAHQQRLGLTFLLYDTLQFVVGQLYTAPLATGSRWSAQRISTGQPMGMVLDTTRTRFYWLESGSNYLVSCSATDNTVAALVEGFGDPPIEQDTSLVAGLAYDPTATTRAGVVVGAVYGISGAGLGTQADPQTQSAPLPAKSVLWQFAPQLADRIELADFGGLSCWDALAGMLAVGDFIMGFDGAGNFYFKPRPASTVLQATVKASGFVDGAVLEAARLRVRPGFRERVNYVSLAPARAVLQPPEAPSGVFVERASALGRTTPTGADAFAAQVAQANTRTLNVFLRCAQGSTPGAPDDGAVNRSQDDKELVDYSPSATQKTHKLRFAFLLYDRVVETQLLLAVSSGTTLRVPLSATADVTVGTTYGDAIEIVHPTTGAAAIFTATAKADSAAGGYSDMTVTPAVAASYALGQKVTIRTYRTNRWSDGPTGVTTVQGAINGTDAIGTDATLTLASTEQTPRLSMLRVVSAAGSEDLRVTSVVSATQVTARRGCGGTTVRAHSVGDVVQVFYAPILNTTYAAGILYPIGGTGVSLSLTPPPKEGSTVREQPFVLGDTIDLVCPGLMLETQGQATVVAMDEASIRVAGRKEWRGAAKARLLTFAQAREVAQRIVADYAKARWLVTTDGPCVRLPALGETYLVREDRLLPWAMGSNPNGNATPVAPDTTTAVACSVRAYDVDPLQDTLRMTLRALNSHAW